MHRARTPAITFRPAVGGDSQRIWEWRNEAAAREASFNSDLILLDTHAEWFARVLEGAGPMLLVATDGAGQDIGYVRFDVEDDTAELSVCIDLGYRGRGVGRTVIRDSSHLVIRESHLRRVIAFVKPRNERSLAAFLAAGFVAHGRQWRGGVEACVLEFTAAGAGTA